MTVYGLLQILCAYTSATATNGSAFAGLNANAAFYNLTLSLAMFIGRFFVIIPVLAIAGNLAAKRIVPRSAGTLPTSNGLFVGFLCAVILIVGEPHLLPGHRSWPRCRTFRDAGRRRLLNTGLIGRQFRAHTGETAS